jgi:serine/threonine protein phosphatase PrpC
MADKSDIIEPPTFIEVGHFGLKKHLQNAAGDMFFSQKNDGRVLVCLSDGLGSGIKAGVLATLTATMATKFISLNIPIRRAAEIIMNTLPVCKERGISYATFTLVDIGPNAALKVMEYDNPPYLLIRHQTFAELDKEMRPIERKNKNTAPVKEARLYYSKSTVSAGDRLVFFSDGVTQAGMGSADLPFGWGIQNVRNFILNRVTLAPDISARALAHAVVQEAAQRDSNKPKDDISCAVVYFRHPRDTLVLSGPPLRPENDKDFARCFSLFNGTKIISGGTTANIISRELGKPISLSLKDIDPHVPPFSRMEGADLVTEGIITMSVASEILENSGEPSGKANAATKMVDLLLNSDRISFMVGTKINDAHQDPNMPVELEIRRNIIKKIALLLEEKYLKEVHIQYF